MPDDAAQTILVDSNTGEWRRLPNGKETRTERDGTILIRDHVSRKKSEDEQDFFRNLAETDLGESILDVLAHKKYHQDIAAHVRLPYKKSWLKQKDPFVLARKNLNNG